MLSPVLRSILNKSQKKRLLGISDDRTKQMVSLEAGQQPGLTQPKKNREKKEVTVGIEIAKKVFVTFDNVFHVYLMRGFQKYGRN